MQRINWFPDPNITGTVKPETGNNANINYLIVNNRKWLQVASTATGNSYAQYNLSGSQLPPAGSYHVHANTYAKNGEAAFMVVVRVNGSYRPWLNVQVGNDQTVAVDRTISVPSGCDQILVRISLNSQPAGAIGMMSDILIERADTYDTAVGGASGLLHRGHDATWLTPAVGVMQDEDNQHGQKSGSQHHHITQRGSDHSMRSVEGRRHLSGQHIRQRQWRHSLIGFADYRQINEGQLATDADCNSDQVLSRFRRAIRQADRHRDRYAHLHVCRLSGEQDSARLHQIFHRGYDAARLTLMGVMA